MRAYQTKQNKGGLPDSITVEKWGAGEINSRSSELENAVSSSGQTLATSDGTGEVLDQLAKAMSIYGAGGAEHYLDTGAADAYVLTIVSPKKSPEAYFDGFCVVFKPGNLNTGASTVTVAGIGSKSITTVLGAALVGGELAGIVVIKYNLSSDRFELVGKIATDIFYDNTTSGLTATEVQSAIDEVFVLTTNKVTSINKIIITASGTYSKPSNLIACSVKLCGGGGGGGSALATGAGEAAIGVGGGAGGYCEKLFLPSELGATETLTIGAGGAGGVASAGGGGGNTTFGVLLSANGGVGGTNGGVTTVTVTNGVSGGGASGGDINLLGEPSMPVAVSGGDRTSIGGGASSKLGSGGKSLQNATGDAAAGYGAGGGAPANGASSAARDGGAGSPGIIIITEYLGV